MADTHLPTSPRGIKTGNPHRSLDDYPEEVLEIVLSILKAQERRRDDHAIGGSEVQSGA